MEPYSPQRLAVLEGLGFDVVLFGLTITAVLQNPNFISLDRNLHCLEMYMYSGQSSHIARAAAAAGRSAAAYDKLFSSASKEGSPQEAFRKYGGDITTYEGFFTAVTLTMRLAPGGLLFAAPDCSSFVGWPSP